MARSIILTSKTELASRTSRRQISSKSISRAIVDYHHIIDTVPAAGSLDAIEFGSFFEVSCLRPVSLKITPAGGSEFTIRIQNYFCFTAQTADSFSVVIANEDATETTEVQITLS